MEYGFSVALGIQRQKGYVLIPGLRTSRVAPVLNIGMSAPTWVKYLTSYGYHNNSDFSDPNQFNEMIFNRKSGVLFQGITWRLRDPKDPVGFGIGMSKANRMGILNSIYPEGYIRDVSFKLGASAKKDAIASFGSIFNPGAIARLKQKDLLNSFDIAAKLKEPYRSYEVVSIFVDTIKNAVRDDSLSDQNSIGTTVRGFMLILNLLRLEPAKLTKENPAMLLCDKKPGDIQPQLSPRDIAVIFHEFVQNAESGGLPILLAFIVFDILGATQFRSPEEVLWIAPLKLPSDSRIENYLASLYSRVATLLEKAGYSPQFSNKEFRSVCSPDAVRKEAIWWEYNLVLARLEALMRDFVGPYRFSTPWSGTFKQEYTRLSQKPSWLKQARVVSKRTLQLAKNISTQDVYALAINEENLQGWFRDIQSLIKLDSPVDTQLRLFWKFSEKIAETDDDPVANFDYKTDTIRLHKDPRYTNPYIQRPVLWDWMRRFGRIWSTET
jgi:hypothetical protein